MTLWDTKWTYNSQMGTAGDWDIQPLPEPEVEPLDGSSTSALNVGNVGGLKRSDDLGTAVITALFTNARLPDHMVGENGWTVEDQRAYHGNSFGIDRASGEEPLGSLLFTLRRAPLTDYSAKLAEHYAALALQTLVRQGLCSGFSITAEVDRAMGRINMKIVVLGAGENRVYTAELFTLR